MNDVVVETTATEVSATTAVVDTKVVNLVKGSDGIERDFGKRSNVLTDIVVNGSNVKVIFALSSGEVLTYERNLSTSNNFEAQVFARGAANKIRTAVTGIKDSSNLVKAYSDAILDLTNEVLETRTMGSIVPVLALKQIEQAYAKVFNLDITTYEGQSNVREIFNNFTLEQLNKVKESYEIKEAIGLLKQEAAERYLEALRKEKEKALAAKAAAEANK